MLDVGVGRAAVTDAVGSTVVVAFFAAPLIDDNISIDRILNLHKQSRIGAVTELQTEGTRSNAADPSR